MPTSGWFLGSTPPLNQLGQTMGVGVTGGRQPGQQGQMTPEQFEEWARLAEQQSAEDRRRWDAEYRTKKSEVDQKWYAARRGARNDAEANAIDRWKAEQDTALARERLGQEDRHFQAKMGYDVLNMGAQLRGPENYFQAANFARGTAGNPQTATFLTALQNNQRLAGFNQQGGMPNPETLGTLGAKLTGGGPDNSGQMGVIGNIAAKGAHQLGAGALEQLTGTEQKLFTSGLDALGIDTPTFLQQYQRSRVSQGSHRAA